MKAPTATDHLKPNRSLVLSRALLAGAAGLLPVPYLDDLLAGAVRSALVRRLAEIRNVDVDANAVEELAHPAGSRVMGAATVGAAALGATRRAFRRLAASLLIVRRADESVQTYLYGTLFDHYCAKHHVGLGLDGKRAAVLRQTMDLAVQKTRVNAAKNAFNKGISASGALVVKLPRMVLGVFRRREPVVPEKVEAFERRLDVASESGPVKRALVTVEAELSAAEQGYLETLLASFDLAWAAANAPRPGTAA